MLLGFWLMLITFLALHTLTTRVRWQFFNSICFHCIWQNTDLCFPHGDVIAIKPFRWVLFVTRTNESDELPFPQSFHRLSFTVADHNKNKNDVWHHWWFDIKMHRAISCVFFEFSNMNLVTGALEWSYEVNWEKRDLHSNLSVEPISSLQQCIATFHMFLHGNDHLILFRLLRT